MFAQNCDTSDIKSFVHKACFEFNNMHNWKSEGFKGTLGILCVHVKGFHDLNRARDSYWENGNWTELYSAFQVHRILKALSGGRDYQLKVLPAH